jgi:hypothetical protein
MRGKGVEIRVGPTPSQDETWTLPLNLLSYHSLYVTKACLWSKNKQLHLPEHDPAIFSLFVEWMYYGDYSTFMLPKHPNVHARCWILADYLLCQKFQTYAMGRLFDEHVGSNHGIVGFEDVQYVCNNTPSDSKLRKFYLDFVADHFGNLNCLLGNLTDWQRLLVDEPYILSALFRKLRYGETGESHVKRISDYTEFEPIVAEPPRLRMNIDVAGLALEKKEDEVPEPHCGDANSSSHEQEARGEQQNGRLATE